MRTTGSRPPRTPSSRWQATAWNAPAAPTPESALVDADLIVTAVTVSLGEGRLSGAGTTADAVLLPLDYDDALAPAAALGAALYAVDDMGQYRSTFPESFAGFPEPHGELADIVAGRLPVLADARSVLMHLGIAMDDVALGALAYDRARQRGIGRPVPFG